MSKLSILIPSRNERYLAATIDDVFAKAAGEIEVIAVLDGYWPHVVGQPTPKERPNLITIHRAEPRGMRDGINSAAAVATGEFLLKCDAHVMFDHAFDEVLKADCLGNQIIIPRRYPLDVENWKIQDNGKPPVDYEYLSWPWEKPNELGMHGNRWDKRGRERQHLYLDDNMSFQGSCWMMRATHWKRIGGMSEIGYERFVQEAQELGNKTWLGGGEVLTNKATWYAHWHKGKSAGRGYFISKGEMIRGTHFSADYWINNRWPDRTRDIEWLIDKFWPVPTWPEDWREHVGDYVLGPNGLLQPAAPLAATGD